MGTRRTIAVLGATGYVGGRLVSELVNNGEQVRCVVRTPGRLSSVQWRDDVDVVAGDTLKYDSLVAGFAGADVVYHLVHAMSDDGDFSQADRESAKNVAAAAAAAGVQRIVYLGGLGDPEDPTLSTHLSSRHEVGRLLAEGPVPVTEIRAAVIIGSGSASFEMLRSLAEHLPMMVVPRWVTKTLCQPVSIRDVLHYLVAVIDVPDTAGRVLDIGGTDVMTYREMMDEYASVAGLRKRIIMPVPVLTPKLSSHWINFVTPLPIGLAKHLVDSLCNDVVVRPSHDIRSFIDHEPSALAEAIRAAIARIKDMDVETSWSDAQGVQPATPDVSDPVWSGGTIFKDVRTVLVNAEPQEVFQAVMAVGGREGWYASTPLWQIRGWFDKLIGGVGMRRGRRHPTDLRVGDALDFFRVEDVRPNHFLRLRAEMKVPGYAWLQWEIAPHEQGTLLTQAAVFVPRGLAGRAYWYSLVPFHAVIFPKLVRQLGKRAEERDQAATTTA
jgi:uncharacterized protein YbjT (DUF2867 family)/uncharacterized protein YndB with AHSA1/START domain